MKTLFSGIQKQRLVIFSFLLTFLFSGIGVVQGLPIFVTALAHAHPVFFSEDNNRIRILLHHPGNHDAHETASVAIHQHDLMDAVIGVSEKDDFSHRDHEVEISSVEDTFSVSAKTQLTPDAQIFFTAPNALPVFSRETQVRFSGLSPPVKTKSHLSLRTTILII
ncbi:MAG: hypothetical protein ACE5IY_24015 [bacterium]